jgi:hypothetical protein
MVNPPTLRTLIEDPMFRTYMKKVPSLPRGLRHGNPWAVWVLLKSGKWRGGKFHTYQESWPVVVKALRSSTVEDVSLVSLRWPFNPPEQYLRAHPGFKTSNTYVIDNVGGFDWCYRCRRPTEFLFCMRHHALRKAAAITNEDPYRCFYCGVRRGYAPMGRGNVA